LKTEKPLIAGGDITVEEGEEKTMLEMQRTEGIGNV